MQQPSVGRIVHYYDREEIVNADHAKRTPEPFAAVIARVVKDDQGEDTEVLTLAVLDPEIGLQVKRDVRPGDEESKPEAHRWYWPPLFVGRTPPARLRTQGTMSDTPAGDPPDDEENDAADAAAGKAGGKEK